LGGFLADINYELLFWVDGFTNIGVAILMGLVLKPVNYKPAKKQKIDDPLIQSAYKDKTYLSFAFITILFACCFFQMFNNPNFLILPYLDYIYHNILSQKKHQT